MNGIRAVCVYCGSQSGRNPAYARAGRQLGEALADAGIEVVYGGGAKGIMGAVSEGALSRGGRVTGIIPHFLVAKEASELSLHRLSEAVLTEDMHQRKHEMFDRSDAFVALPGGIGTLEEIVEIMTWGQLARHAKPIAFVNTEGFWDTMLSLLAHMRQEGFIHTSNRVQPIVGNDPHDVVARIREAAAVARPEADETIARL